MTREVCPYCGVDALLGPKAHTNREQCVMALKQKYCLQRSRIKGYVVDHVREQHNHIGGVIGYTLQLNDEETEHLMQLIEGKI